MQNNYSILQNSNERFTRFMVSIVSKTQRCTLLILDQLTSSILDTLVALKDLFKIGISNVEKLELKRKPYKHFIAIYFISEQSIPLLLNDFTDGYMYHKVYLYFPQIIDRTKLEQISQNTELMSRIVQIKEYNHHIYFLDHNVFTIHSEDKLFERLITLIPSLEKYKSLSLAYHNTLKNEEAIKMIQNFGQKAESQLNQWNKDGQQALDLEGQNAVILFFDRSQDLVTPLLHDFNYYSLLSDLMVNEDGIIEEGQIRLDKIQDGVFQKYKYQHIAQVLEGIPKDFQEMVNSNPSAKIHSGQAIELDYKKMQEIIATMPNYNEMLKHYTYHMKLIDQIWKQFERRGLKDLADLEQCLATGVTKDGHQTDSSILLNEVYLMLQSKIINEDDKKRLVLIALLTIQMPEQDRKKLAGNEKILKKLSDYGINAVSQKITKNVDKQTREMAKLKLSQMTMDLQRHTSVIERIVDEFTNKKSNFQMMNLHGQYEKCQDYESKSKIRIQEKVNKDIVIVFFLGGVVPGEICSLIQKNVLIGSTEMIDSNTFLKKLIE